MSGRGTTRRRLGDGLGNDRTDWQRLRTQDDAAILEAIRDDPDAVDPGEAWLRSVQVPSPAVAREQLTVPPASLHVPWSGVEERWTTPAGPPSARVR